MFFLFPVDTVNNFVMEKKTYPQGEIPSPGPAVGLSTVFALPIIITVTKTKK